MKRINILILEDNFVIAQKIKSRLFKANEIYAHQSGVEIFPYYLEVDNENPEIAAIKANEYIKLHDIEYLLLDRSFGSIIEPKPNNEEEHDVEYLYKDNTKKGYYIEELLKSISCTPKHNLTRIKGIVVYTYDNYMDENKQGEIIKAEIEEELKKSVHSKCKIDILLAYTNIYKLAEINIYEGYSAPGIIKFGRKKDFVLYGIFAGELLYHKLLQMINIKNMEILSQKKTKIFYRLSILYTVFISISIGSNAIYAHFFSGNGIIINIVMLLFGILVPFLVLVLDPSILIDLDE